MVKSAAAENFAVFFRQYYPPVFLLGKRSGDSSYTAYGRFKFFAPTALKIFAIAIVGEQQFVVLAAA